MFLADKVLNLLLLLLWHRVRWPQPWNTSLIPFFLHFFILIQQLFLQVIILLLIFWSLIPSRQYITSNSLELPFHLKARLLFLQLLYLLLNNLIMLILLIKRPWLWLIGSVHLLPSTVKLVWRRLNLTAALGLLLLVIHWKVLLAYVLNPWFLRIVFHYLLDTARERSLGRSFYLVFDKVVFVWRLCARVLHQTVWSTLFVRIHWLHMVVFFSVCLISLTTHLSFGSLNILILAYIMTCWVTIFLLGELASSLNFLGLVIYRILILNVIVRCSYKSSITIVFSAIICQDILIHQEVNPSRKLIYRHIFMSTTLLLSPFISIQSCEYILLFNTSVRIKQLFKQLNFVNLMMTLHFLKQLLQHLNIMLLFGLTWVLQRLVWTIFRDALEDIAAPFGNGSLLFLDHGTHVHGFLIVLVETL